LLAHRLTWIGLPPAYSPRRVGETTVVVDGDDFLLDAAWHDSDFFVIGQVEHGVPALDLVRLIRKRSQAGLIVLSGAGGPPLAAALRAGADLVLPDTADADDLQAAMEAVQRRVHPPGATAAVWTFSASRSLLATPEGHEIALSDAELQVIGSFAEAAGQPVSREQLMQRVWGGGAAGCSDNALQAIVYRLRRRIEQSGAAFAPIQSVARVGYRFCAPLLPEPVAGGPAIDVMKRHQVQVQGPASARPPLVFVHGYGCDQGVWSGVLRALGPPHRSLCYDLAGHGGSAPEAYSNERHATLDGHAQDLIEVCCAGHVQQPVVVGHSVGASIAMLAALREPQRFKALVLVAPSPYYINDGDYHGGFDRNDLLDLLQQMDDDYLPWARRLAPLLMGRPDRPELATELGQRLCRTDPAVARHFGRVSFLSDVRPLLPRLTLPALVLQCQQDPLVPTAVGDFLQAALPQGRLVRLEARGHCPHLSAAQEVAGAIETFLANLKTTRR
jgi:sigma-B regulation protein RsbQ